MIKTITPSELQQIPGAVLIDVRTPAEFDEAHIPGSHLFPLTALDCEGVRKLANGSVPCLICRGGTRAKQAAEKLSHSGLPETLVLGGGVQAWQAAGLPTRLGRKAMSLERQVRIAAGSLVLLGVALGFAVHPGFFGLAAFVGAGLVFSGTTDTCGMAMMLARMPWNNRAPSSSASCEKS